MAKVGTKHASYKRFQERWELIDSLKGGSEAMRLAGVKYLPRETKESIEAYYIRLNRNFLFGGFVTTINDLSLRPLAKNPILHDAPKEVKDIAENGDSPFSDIVRGFFRSGMEYGLFHVLVDFPSIPQGSPQSREIEAKPYFTLVNAPDLWNWETNDNGIVTEVHICETIDNEEGKSVHQIRVIREGVWEIWRKPENSENYALVQNGVMTFAADNEYKIPFVTVYFNKTGFMQADPPLYELAELNLAHWQSSADQRASLRFARLGILFAAGFEADEYETGFEIGPSRVIKSVNPSAKLEYVEHTGKAMEIGREDLASIEEKMERLGMKPLRRRSGTETATAKAIDTATANSDLQAWTISMEQGLKLCLQVAGRWKRATVPDSMRISLFKDFGIGDTVERELKLLLAMRTSGDLTRETLIAEVQRRGLFSENFDLEEELAKLSIEVPEMPREPVRSENPGPEDDSE